MKKNKKHFSSGLTMIEVLIYIGIFGFLSIAIIKIFISTFAVFAQVRAYNGINRTGSAIMERLIYQTRNGSSIGATSSFGTSPSTMAINVEDGSGTSHLYTYTLSGTILQESIDSGTAQAMHGSGQKMNSFVVNQITAGPSKALRITFVLQDTRVTPNVTSTFTTTVMVRGTY